jgi:hypothetical protein
MHRAKATAGPFPPFVAAAVDGPAEPHALRAPEHAHIATAQPHRRTSFICCSLRRRIVAHLCTGRLVTAAKQPRAKAADPLAPAAFGVRSRPVIDGTQISGIARQAVVNAWTREVVAAMHARGIRPVLLKGPVIARWLYADAPWTRPYVDVDLLVAPDDAVTARALLVGLGFEPAEHPVLPQDGHHALPFLRRRDGATVDLHRSFHGLDGLSPERIWRAVSEHLEPIIVAGVELDAPDATLRALTVVLHLRAVDGACSQPWRDLERALALVGPIAWREVVELVRRLGVEPAFAARLRRLEAGARLADELGLGWAGSPRFELIGAVDRGDAPASVLSLHALRTGRDPRYALRKLFPPREQLHRDFPRLARAGTGGLAAARVLRPLRILAGLPGALTAYRRLARGPRPRSGRSPWSSRHR